MKKLFHQFYRPTESEFRKLWQTCIFALDASVLLNLYGYSDETREQLIALIERLAARIRMPHQFAFEYQRNRAHAIMEQVKNYAKAEKTLDAFYTGEILPKTKHPFLSRKAMKAFNLVQQELTNNRAKHEVLFSNDPYFNRVTALIKNVGPPSADWDRLCEEARQRYARKIPPGFADQKDKGEPEAFGDFIGWTQLIDLAKIENTPAILVTDDAKDDWWQMQGDRTIGPRPELLAEFHIKCGQSFYMYSCDQFMRFANTYLKQRVPSDAIQEVEERVHSQMRSTSSKKSVGASTIQAASNAKPIVPISMPSSQNLKPIMRPDELKQEKPREQPMESVAKKPKQN